jgi:hypothetical protein
MRTVLPPNAFDAWNTAALLVGRRYSIYSMSKISGKLTGNSFGNRLGYRFRQPNSP